MLPFPGLFKYTIKCLCQVIDYRFYFLFVGCVKISCISVNSIVDANRRMQLQYLDLTDCVIVQDGGLRIIVQNCPQLAYLYLRRCIQITGMYQSQINSSGSSSLLVVPVEGSISESVKTAMRWWYYVSLCPKFSCNEFHPKISNTGWIKSKDCLL